MKWKASPSFSSPSFSGMMDCGGWKLLWMDLHAVASGMSKTPANQVESLRKVVPDLFAVADGQTLHVSRQGSAELLQTGQLWSYLNLRPVQQY